VVGTVLLTTVAGAVFCWLRVRSGSLLAPVLLHWALNGLGLLAVHLA
jgi:membrane protease YdiL (CAAX protease family)